MSKASLGFIAFTMLSCAVATAQDSAIVALQECVAQFEVPDENGETPRLKEIEEACPDLRQILEDSPYAAWLPEDWWNPLLTTESLEQLQELFSSEPVATATWSADTSGVTAALATLGEDSRDEPSRWDRLREWLRSRLEGEAEKSPSWLIEWFEKLDQHEQAIRIMGYTLFALIVLAALWIVFNEVRAAGVFGARAARLARGAGGRDGARPGDLPTIDDLERTEPANRPSLLLTLLLGTMARRQDRAVDRSFTHRELARRVTLDSDWQRGAFAQLLNCAERVRYAAELPARNEIDDAVLGGRRLLESISVPAAARTT